MGHRVRPFSSRGCWQFLADYTDALLFDSVHAADSSAVPGGTFDTEHGHALSCDPDEYVKADVQAPTDSPSSSS